MALTILITEGFENDVQRRWELASESESECEKQASQPCCEVEFEYVPGYQPYPVPAPILWPCHMESASVDQKL